MNYEGYIGVCKCISCGLTVNNLVFSGDTDMATGGLVAAALPGKDEVVVVETTADEWNKYDKVAIAKRVNETFKREGFVVLNKQLFKDEASGKDSYDPVCTNCGNRQAMILKLSLEEFEAKGGKIHEMTAH